MSLSLNYCTRTASRVCSTSTRPNAVNRNINCRNEASLESRRSLILTTTGLVFGASVGTAHADIGNQTEITNATQDFRKVYFDISIESEAIGRVVIELYDDVKVGSQRFLDLAIGKEGVRYQASKFTKLTEGYIVNGGVKSLSLSNTADVPIAGGASLDGLLNELKEQHHLHNQIGVVSLIVKNANERPKKKKLVAIKGKFVTVEEGGSLPPNGTAFAITTQPALELDETNLVIGHVVDGIDIIQRLQTLPRVKNNSDSVFLKTAKLIGDVRADVAEQSFGKPFSRIRVISSGAV